MEDLPDGDVKTYDMICKADTIGVFQIESRAQIDAAAAATAKYYDLVVEVAIVRPGPIQGGMVHPYLKRRGVSPHPQAANLLRRRDPPRAGPHLGRTDLPGAGHAACDQAAGFTPGQADQLRRSMAAWRRRGDLKKHQDAGTGADRARLSRIVRAGHLQADRGVWEYAASGKPCGQLCQARSSAPGSSHYPEAFLCALLNSQPMGFYSPSQLVQDARRHGVTSQPVDVTISNWESTLEPRREGQNFRDVRLHESREGCARLPHCGSRAACGAAIRQRRGPRSPRVLDRHDIDAWPQPTRWYPSRGIDEAPGTRVARRCRPRIAICCTMRRRRATQLPEPKLGEDVTADYASLGLSLKCHPLTLLRHRLSRAQVRRHANSRTAPTAAACACGIVTVRQRPSGQRHDLHLDRGRDRRRQRHHLARPGRRQRRVLGATLGAIGTWQRQGEVRHLVADELVDLSPLLGRLMVGVGIFIEKEVNFPAHASGRAQQAGSPTPVPNSTHKFSPCKQTPPGLIAQKIRQSTLSQYRRGLAGCQEIIHALCG
jgi:error-prone DNA polymerase